MTKEEYIKKCLSGWSREVAEREYNYILVGDRYDSCPLRDLGFRLESFMELPSVVIGPDNKRICTKDQPCLNVDRRDGNRCTVKELRELDHEAATRRAWQSGDD